MTQPLPGYTHLDSRSLAVLNLAARAVASISGEVIELGVCGGGSTALLAQWLPHHQVVAVDSFEGLVDYGPNDPESDVGVLADAEAVRAALAEFENVRLVQGHFPDPDCVREIGTGPYALAHYDADLYAPAMAFFDHVWPRMEIGGVLVVDDYGEGKWKGVRTAFRDYFGRDPSLWSGRQALHVKTDD